MIKLIRGEILDRCRAARGDLKTNSKIEVFRKLKNNF
jgi:hypothetical protein